MTINGELLIIQNVNREKIVSGAPFIMVWKMLLYLLNRTFKKVVSDKKLNQE